MADSNDTTELSHEIYMEPSSTVSTQPDAGDTLKPDADVYTQPSPIPYEIQPDTNVNMQRYYNSTTQTTPEDYIQPDRSVSTQPRQGSYTSPGTNVDTQPDYKQQQHTAKPQLRQAAGSQHLCTASLRQQHEISESTDNGLQPPASH